MGMETLSEHACFGGVQGFYRHNSSCCSGAMRFGVYQPPQAQRGRVPVLYFLAGLTCTEQTFAMKAGAQRLAAELGLMLVTPDTSPRDTGVEGATGDWELGEGAGFYVDATQAPWAAQFQMESYVVDELPTLIASSFPADTDRSGICGHSMGGHGALTLALRHPHRYRSVSALAPIVAPSQVPWGEKAFSHYLGNERETWLQHDACALIAARVFPGTILVDQGEADQFLHNQLQPERIERACAEAGQPLNLRRHPHYDHSYYFIASVIADHLAHHAQALTT